MMKIKIWLPKATNFLAQFKSQEFLGFTILLCLIKPRNSWFNSKAEQAKHNKIAKRRISWLLKSQEFLGFAMFRKHNKIAKPRNSWLYLKYVERIVDTTNLLNVVH